MFVLHRHVHVHPFHFWQAHIYSLLHGMVNLSIKVIKLQQRLMTDIVFCPLTTGPCFLESNTLVFANKRAQKGRFIFQDILQPVKVCAASVKDMHIY